LELKQLLTRLIQENILVTQLKNLRNKLACWTVANISILEPIL
jgi:hypothetical protein